MLIIDVALLMRCLRDFYGGNMFDYLKKCFSVNLNDYTYIKYDLEINKAVVIAVIALMIGIIFMNLYRSNIRLITLQLTRHSADTEENAKTLSELGLGDSKVIKSLLSKKGMLTKIITRVGEKTYSYEEYIILSDDEKKKIFDIDFEAAKFYIKEENKAQADGIIEKYNASTLRTVITCVFIGIVGLCVIFAMPEILNGIDLLIKTTKM